MTDSESHTSGGATDSEQPLNISAVSDKPSPARALAIGVSRLLWRGRAERWDREGSTQLGSVVDAVLERSDAPDGAVAVDLGCGSGQVTFPLARRCSHVLAVDIDEGAIELLAARATREKVENIQVLAQAIEKLELEPESVDLVVSNYALHHVRDTDKRLLVERALIWLRPGGRLVIGDMMFGRGADQADRQIIREKIRALVRRGPGGWWRIVKNGLRFLLRFQEKPLRPDAWAAIVHDAGFANVKTDRVVAEACVVSATRPRTTPNRDRPDATCPEMTYPARAAVR